MVIHPAAISIIRRARLPVCGARTSTAGTGSPVAGSAAAAAGASATGSVSAAGLVGVVEAVTQSTDGGDHVGTQLLADAGDEDLDSVGIAVEVLVVDMLDQLSA